MLVCHSVAEAGVFRCEAADGAVSYQHTPCEASQAARQLDPVPAAAAESARTGQTKDSPYSVVNQLQAIESARARQRAARADSTAAPHARQPDPITERRDRAKCAKHRAAAAQWARAVRMSYRHRSEQIHRREMLAYHQALIERFCHDD